jgi:hypothetical protein
VTRNARRKLFTLGVLLVPALLVKGTAFLMGNPVARSVSAAEETKTSDAAAITPLKKVEASPQQKRVAAHIAMLRQQAFPPSPMYYNVTEEGTHVEATEFYTSDVHVQAVMGSASGHSALINRKVYKVGQKIGATAWIITNINPETRTVTIQNEATGEVQEYSVKVAQASPPPNE